MLLVFLLQFECIFVIVWKQLVEDILKKFLIREGVVLQAKVYKYHGVLEVSLSEGCQVAWDTQVETNEALSETFEALLEQFLHNDVIRVGDLHKVTPEP